MQRLSVFLLLFGQVKRIASKSSMLFHPRLLNPDLPSNDSNSRKRYTVRLPMFPEDGVVLEVFMSGSWPIK